MEAVIICKGDFPKKEYPRELLRRADVIICCDGALEAFLRNRDKIFKTAATLMSSSGIWTLFPGD